MAVPAAPVQQANPQAINAMARRAVVQNSVNMLQPLTSVTFSPASNPTQTFNPRNVGLLKRLFIEVTATISNTGTAAIALTDMGLGNILSQVTFFDLNNYQRILTTGQHLAFLASVKRKRPAFGTYQTNAYNGNNLSQPHNVNPASWGVFQAPQTIAAGGTGTLRMVYEVPLAYSDDDLRGAIYANVINANLQLGVTVNPTPVVAGTADTSTAVYSGAAGAAGSFTAVTLSVYQNYLDQLPQSNGQIVLPTLDLSTVYELKNTTFAAITPNQDFFIPFGNMRSFVSAFVTYNNNGQASGRTYGTDTNYLALRAANLTDLWHIDPLLAVQRSRDILGFDLPAGVQYFDFRRQPISTNTYGNMQLVGNFNVAAAGAYANVFWEDFGILNALTGATSLSAS